MDAGFDPLNLQTMGAIFLWVFLGIFVLTALLTLAGLPENGPVKLHEKYKSKLVTALILEVAGCIIGFVGWTVPNGRSAHSPPMSVAAISRMDHGWYWEYAEAGWRTHASLEGASGKLSLIGQTSVGNVAVFDWKTTRPGTFDKDGNLTLMVREAVLPSAVTALGATAPAAGEYDVEFKLKPIVAFTGSWTSKSPSGREVRGGIGCLYNPNLYLPTELISH